MRRRLVLPVVALALLFACAQQSIPPEFQELEAEVTILEISRYLDLMRDGYVDAARRGVLSHENFVLAVQADRSLVTAWNQYIEIRRAGGNDPAKWAEVLTLIAGLEQVAMQYVPKAEEVKPAALTGG